MQYFGRAIGSVSKTWNSINPATLSGAIDVIVVEDDDGEMRCSPFHVRFGKFQLLRPSQKKVSVIVNGEATDIPMKLSDGGEAFFVFETDCYVPEYLQTSPVVSAISSPSDSPRLPASATEKDELEYLDIGEGVTDSSILKPKKRDSGEASNNSNLKIPASSAGSSSPLGSMSPIERAKSISMKLNIPSRVEANGDIFLDMHGYKSDKQDIYDTDVLVKQLLQEEFGDDVDVKSMMNKDLEGNITILNADTSFSDSLTPSSPPSVGSSVNNISSSDKDATTPPPPTEKPSSNDVISIGEESDLPKPSSSSSLDLTANDRQNNQLDTNPVHFKTLRLSSEQLKCLSLNHGENDITYSVNDGKSVITCKLFLWKRSTPIVISDIDGTITRSDALGHVLTMLGRDWTHEGVAKLFDDIEFNGYNIMYLTARSVGLADTTRSYLQGVEQEGYKLPQGPVILSPDRTIAALKREIVLKKPEVFKMACLNDIRTLYYPEKTNPLEHEHHVLFDYEDTNEEDGMKSVSGRDIGKEEGKDYKNDGSVEDGEEEEQEEEGWRGSDISDDEFTDVNTNTKSDRDEEIKKQMKSAEDTLSNGADETKTPFYAGFGNRITDAISYRSVGVPSSRIFTINPEGDVKMELLEMAGYKSSYVSIVELVDQFFPPVEIKNEKKRESDGASRSLEMSMSNARNKYTDFNYWRSPDIDLSLISDSESELEGDGSGRGDIMQWTVDNRGRGLLAGHVAAAASTRGSTGQEDVSKSVVVEPEVEGPGTRISSSADDGGHVGDPPRHAAKLDDNERDDETKAASRFSFFLRSPRRNTPISDTRQDEEGAGDLNKMPVGSRRDGAGAGGGVSAQEDESDELGLLSDESDETASDSDYIYEASDEGEDDDHHEDGAADHADGPAPHRHSSPHPPEQPKGRNTSINIRKLNRSTSVSGLSDEKVLGRFV